MVAKWSHVQKSLHWVIVRVVTGAINRKRSVRVGGCEVLLYFCLPLIPLGALREERDVCLLHVGMPGQEGCCTKVVSL